MFKGTTDNGKTFIPASTYWLCMSKGIGSSRPRRTHYRWQRINFLSGATFAHRVQASRYLQDRLAIRIRARHVGSAHAISE